VIHYFLLANQGGNMNKASFCFLIIILWQLSNFVFGAIPASERAALIALYNSTNGDNWYYNKGWKTPPLHTDGFAMPGTEGSWQGVALSGNHVSSIKLLWHNLSGSIPPELGNLSNLKSLWLVGNQLSGSIPPQLGNLSDLSGLYLRYNQLSGSIPSELGNLSNLHELYLDYNQLSGSIPPELGNLSNLHWLFLDNNRLSGSIPPELGNLSNLFCLNLGSNQLSGSIPSNFTNLTNLSYLDVGYNCLFAADSTFISWLNSHDPDWEATQCLEKAPPFGYFETPIHNSTVCSSVAVTGWALDDYGMDSVKIYCEYENTLVFIGDAIFVEGARPDVEAAYPGYPENDRAGWGYMLLTNFLPNGGNGTYVLHAIATDRYGKTTTLGTKTIIVDNAHAVKPFGAIDTPVQGGTASGSGFVNWGWALTPAPNKIPIDGSTIDVWIDGVNIGHPTYNIYRSDIASFFPNYANSNGAVGYFYLDTTKYTNGVHTIQWTAADNAGNIDGIGSRYFAVQNNDPGSTPTAASSLPGLGRHTGQIPGRTRHTIQELALLPEEKGLNELIIKELDRVEIKLSENHGEILGYLLCSDELKKLPIGSTLDAKTGTFYWSPGLGFLGRYSLVFVLTDPDGQSYKKSIEIEIVPRFNGLWPTD
jgi:hypothetical protein